MSDELTDNEKQMLAREVAADRAYYDDRKRAAFIAGWDAAMEYAAKKMAEGIEHLDEADNDH